MGEEDTVQEICLGSIAMTPRPTTPTLYMCGLQVTHVTDCGWAGVSPGIKLSSLNLEALKVASSLGLCNSVLNYIACFCSLFSVNSHTQGHISPSSAFSWLHLCLRPRCISTVVVHDKLLQLVECNCASIFPICFMVVLPKLLPSFKNRWRNLCVSTP